MKGGEKEYILFKLVVTSYYSCVQLLRLRKELLRNNNTLSLNGFMLTVDLNLKYFMIAIYLSTFSYTIIIITKEPSSAPTRKKYFVQKCFIA